MTSSQDTLVYRGAVHLFNIMLGAGASQATTWRIVTKGGVFLYDFLLNLDYFCFKLALVLILAKLALY